MGQLGKSVQRIGRTGVRGCGGADGGPRGRGVPTIIDMVNVLADMELEVEAATLMMTQMSGAFDRAPTDPDEAVFSRLATLAHIAARAVPSR